MSIQRNLKTHQPITIPRPHLEPESSELARINLRGNQGTLNTHWVFDDSKELALTVFRCENDIMIISKESLS